MVINYLNLNLNLPKLMAIPQSETHKILYFHLSNKVFPSYFCPMERTTARLLLALKGAAMGIAEVIPGVSGGTIALITGIYLELINTIKAVLSPAWIKAWRQEGIAGAWRVANGRFLLFLVGGMAAGVVFGVFVVTHLLETFPQLLWAFFFGLIVASAIYVGRQVSRWRPAQVVCIIAGIALAYWISIANPAQGVDALWYVFLGGTIAISAMILPGISGSFILLLMGLYTYIIPTVKDALKTLAPESLVVLGVFGLGCLIGLGTFSRILSWTFKNYADQTLAVLTGFMIGSLNKIWPWRNVLTYRTNSRGEEVPFLEKNVLPGQYEGDALLAGAILCAIAGFVIVFLLERLGNEE